MTRPRVTTETEAANLALGRVGVSPIVALDDDAKRARAANRLFGPTRDALLRRHPWNFALTWTTPLEEPIPTGAAAGFARRFRLDEADLAVWDVEGLAAEAWTVAGADDASALGPRYLWTNAAAPKALVTRRRDPAAWDAIFVDVFADMLGADLAGPLKGESGDALRDRAEGKLLAAKRADSREGARGLRPRDTSWLAARRGLR